MKTTYLARMQHQVEDWSAEIIRLKRFVGSLSSDTRRTYDNKIKELQKNRDKMLLRIQQMSSSKKAVT